MKVHHHDTGSDHEGLGVRHPRRALDPPPDANPLVANLAVTPVALREIPDARPLRPDWLVTRPRLTGICGSDSKQILLDFGDGDSDNAMSGFCSFPQVMGHEVVAEVVELGPEASGFEVGQRVVLKPTIEREIHSQLDKLSGKRSA